MPAYVINHGRYAHRMGAASEQANGRAGAYRPREPRHTDAEITTVTEGMTRLLVPRGSLGGAAPSRDIAFYNPRASANRDVAVVAYAAFLKGFKGPRTVLEPLAGVGATGIRAAVEHPDANKSATIHHIYQNDANPAAVDLAKRSARLNAVDHVTSASRSEACGFLAGHASGGIRGAVVDVDPFGSPAPFFDCAVRSAYHGGMIACTATDLQVLNGLFDSACRNRYGGTPIRGTTYGSETAIRIVLGCLRSVAARLDASIHPLFVSSHMHYYRMYVKVRMGHAGVADEEMGYAIHCDACGGRGLVAVQDSAWRTGCSSCGSPDARAAGPLWKGPVFDERFALHMAEELDAARKKAPSGAPFRTADKMIKRAVEESAVGAGLFYTIDEIASRLGASPPRIAHVIKDLRDAGYAASQTAMSPTGFRTDAPIDVIRGAFGNK